MMFTICYSILFYSILFYSILFCSVLFYSILLDTTSSGRGNLKAEDEEKPVQGAPDQPLARDRSWPSTIRRNGCKTPARFDPSSHPTPDSDDTATITVVF
ncbi:hypothetical protein Y032_0153g2918 [Ancylostoma ceylanicum]|nr:hypothetical protein Y032_0153g2918 [Ancylostoma ceylanicum]